jgi:hypothetical protein
MSPAGQRIIEASQLKEAIRHSRDTLPGDPNKVDDEDRPIVKAWDKALAEMRAACAAYVAEDDPPM